MDLVYMSPRLGGEADETKPSLQTSNPDFIPSGSTGKLDDKYPPLVYREREETPSKFDSDGQPMEDGNKIVRNYGSLPLRYASHSSCDESCGSNSPSGRRHRRRRRHHRLHRDSAPKVRLSSVLAKRRCEDFQDDDDVDSKRRKEEFMNSQRNDRQVLDRNKRMFGMLIGTLKKFKTEESGREELTLKRSKIEQKLDPNEDSMLSPLVRRTESSSEVINKAEIKLDILGRFKNWESSHKHLNGYIQTETKPKIFWLPKEHNEHTEKQLKSTRDYYNLFVAERTAKCQKEIEDLEKAPPRNLIDDNRKSSRSPENHFRSRRNRSPASFSSTSSSSHL